MHRQKLLIGTIGLAGLLLLSFGLVVVLAGNDGWFAFGSGNHAADAMTVGSTQLTLEVNPVSDGSVPVSLTDQVTHCIRQRADALGLHRARIARHGHDRIVVVIPPVSDLDRVVTTLTQQQLLEVIDPRGVTLASGTIVTTTYAPEGSPAGPSGTPAAPDAVYQTLATSGDLVRAELITNQQSHQPELVLVFSKDAGERLADFTRSHYGQPLAIVIAKRVVVSPVIEGTISTTAAIAGTSPHQTRALYELLQAGNLPTSIDIISEHTITIATPVPSPPATPVPTAIPTPTPIVAEV